MADSETTDVKHPHRWRPGQSGNPSGRPKGARHTALLALDAIGSEGAADALRAVVEAAKGGDMRAADILLRRLWPERKGRAAPLDLPPVRDVADLPDALAAVTAAVAEGDLSPEEGQAVAALLEAQRRVLETADLAARVAALEARTGGGGL
ncbi:MAG: hypothetical protein RLZZ187_2150 [Pseudomonadota bacterium]|jgi:hypothetical protein